MDQDGDVEMLSPTGVSNTVSVIVRNDAETDNPADATAADQEKDAADKASTAAGTLAQDGKEASGRYGV